MGLEYTFTLEPEEYLDFLRYRTASSKQHSGKRLWITTSVPLLIIVSIIFFKLYTQPLVMALGVMLTAIWVLIGAPALWQKFVNGRLNQKLLDKLGVKSFSEVKLRFADDCIEYTDGGLKRIPYSDIRSFFPTASVFVFSTAGELSVLLPTRVIGDQIQIKEFVKAFESRWSKYRTNTGG